MIEAGILLKAEPHGEVECDRVIVRPGPLGSYKIAWRAAVGCVQVVFPPHDDPESVDPVSPQAGLFKEHLRGGPIPVDRLLAHAVDVDVGEPMVGPLGTAPADRRSREGQFAGMVRFIRAAAGLPAVVLGLGPVAAVKNPPIIVVGLLQVSPRTCLRGDCAKASVASIAAPAAIAVNTSLRRTAYLLVLTFQPFSVPRRGSPGLTVRGSADRRVRPSPTSGASR